MEGDGFSPLLGACHRHFSRFLGQGFFWLAVPICMGLVGYTKRGAGLSSQALDKTITRSKGPTFTCCLYKTHRHHASMQARNSSQSNVGLSHQNCHWTRKGGAGGSHELGVVSWAAEAKKGRNHPRKDKLASLKQNALILAFALKIKTSLETFIV